jgi:hypothetical protein
MAGELGDRITRLREGLRAAQPISSGPHADAAAQIGHLLTAQSREISRAEGLARDETGPGYAEAAAALASVRSDLEALEQGRETATNGIGYKDVRVQIEQDTVTAAREQRYREAAERERREQRKRDEAEANAEARRQRAAGRVSEDRGTRSRATGPASYRPVYGSATGEMVGAALLMHTAERERKERCGTCEGRHTLWPPVATRLYAARGWDGGADTRRANFRACEKHYAAADAWMTQNLQPGAGASEPDFYWWELS